MKPRSRRTIQGLVILVALLICGVVGLLGTYFSGGSGGGGSGIVAEAGDMLSLSRPVLALGAEAFPADEAGVSAYVNVGQNIDLEVAKEAFVGIEAEGDGYVIGIVELTGLPEEEFPHVYIHQDGWILAYYTKFAPASRMFQWYGYEGGSFTTTTLEDAIAKICLTIGLNYYTVKGDVTYYHFQYPEATKLLLTVDSMRGQAGLWEDSFNFSIPYAVTLYEGSWSHSIESYSSSYYSRLYLDDALINNVYYNRDHPELSLAICGKFEDSQLIPGMLHTVRIMLKCASTSDWAGAAVVFIYRPL